jgi:hypothetical protein
MAKNQYDKLVKRKIELTNKKDEAEGNNKFELEELEEIEQKIKWVFDAHSSARSVQRPEGKLLVKYKADPKNEYVSVQSVEQIKARDQQEEEQMNINDMVELSLLHKYWMDEGDRLDSQLENLSNKVRMRERQRINHIYEQPYLTLRKLVNIENPTDKACELLENLKLNRREAGQYMSILYSVMKEKNFNLPVVWNWNTRGSEEVPIYQGARNAGETLSDEQWREIYDGFHKDKDGINKTDKNGATPLYIASGLGYTEVVKKLLVEGGDVNQAADNNVTPLYIASQNGHTEVVKMLLAKDGIDVNQAKSNDGTTPLFMASQNGHTGVMKLLLQKEGINVNQPTNKNTTPINMAAFAGQTEAVRVLLGHPGVDINMEDNWKDTPMISAKKKGHSEIVTLLKNYTPTSNIGGGRRRKYKRKRTRKRRKKTKRKRRKKTKRKRRKKTKRKRRRRRRKNTKKTR